MNKVEGLIAAPHTPINENGRIDTGMVPAYFEYLKAQGVKGIFLNGTTSEGYHLAREFRLVMLQHWCQAARGSDFKIFLFAGHLSLVESAALAKDASKFDEVSGIALSAPFFQKPASLSLLIDSVEQVARQVPQKPVYYYHIPVLSGLNFSMEEFLKQAGSRIPNLAGVKYTHNDLPDFMAAASVENGRFDMLAGIDEMAIAYRAIGAKGYIGSTYNFMAPLFHRMLEAFDRHDLDTARALQLEANRCIRIIASYGYISACKAIMRRKGIDTGYVLLPNRQITPEEEEKMFDELGEGFWD